ncbi:hypothetical protein EBI_26918 [Enterocytozoon bieneusi H348]|nr:hypothetical protein EBI_26918 [Enterocytozoon bieneusi H348]|eukprot:XP_002651814.1 hypothetical protein EBI_26918 [Enterocytozoon bieneusi H348]
MSIDITLHIPFSVAISSIFAYISCFVLNVYAGFVVYPECGTSDENFCVYIG